MFVSKERKISSKKGTGTQYLPGHDEPFVDFIIEKYLPDSGNILDLGGGGLRFAIPVALRGKEVTVVDMDPDALDIATIVGRVNSIGKLHIDLNTIRSLIKVENQNIFHYLKETNNQYSFISGFRVIHFNSSQMIAKLFSLVHSKLDKNGLFVVSANTIYNLPNTDEFNEIFLNSTELDSENSLYRKFNNTVEAESLREKQNLPQCVHFVDNQFVCSLAQAHGFEVIESDLQSTRVVRGYVLRRN